MRHDIVVEGETIRLRPVRVEDAAVMVEIRRSVPEEKLFMNPTSPDPADQRAYLETYFDREDDYYFMIERRADNYAIGCVTICEIGQVAPGWAEWGRWVLRPKSNGAVESVWLMFRAGFEILNLDTLYSRTVVDNEQVVSFHDSCGVKRACVLKNYVTLRGKPYDSIEHRLTRAEWSAVEEKLGGMVRRMARKGK